MNNILICDDDLTDIKLFKKYLGPDKLKSINLIEMTSSSALLEYLEDTSNPADLLFLDYYLGADSGLEILRLIKNSERCPVVMLTGRGDQEIAVQCMKEGAVDYFPKETLAEQDILKIADQAISNWKVMKERDLLLGIAAHELRNPLSVILGYTELLLTDEEVTDEEKVDMMSIVHDKAVHMHEIINGLLDVSRVEKGFIELKKETTDLNELAKRKVKEYKLTAARKKITLTFNSTEAGLIANVDPVRIEEVFSNLVDNAIKYSQNNTEVIISIKKEEKRAVISVEDHGQGIREDELQYLFDLFSSKKISSKPTGSETKTGLGLAICKKLIEAHKGEILVTSAPGAGTKFTVLIPL